MFTNSRRYFTRPDGRVPESLRSTNLAEVGVVSDELLADLLVLSGAGLANLPVVLDQKGTCFFVFTLMRFLQNFSASATFGGIIRTTPLVGA